VLREIERGAPDIAIVTMAPELDGGFDLVHWLLERGLRVSLGHSGATYEEAMAAIAAGARHATHLFNRMPPLGHRHPGLVGAVLQSEEVAAELICDGVHVHPALVRMVVAAKRPSRLMAITDGTAGAGLPVGALAKLGDHTITVRESAAFLADGTLAGSVLTMDRAFEMLVARVGVSPVEAAMMCATTPARELGLVGHGVIARDAVADLVVLDANFSVVQTYVSGQLVYARAA
jgi:N-acetylglucosamine-6-phosphate deacetylase